LCDILRSSFLSTCKSILYFWHFTLTFFITSWTWHTSHCSQLDGTGQCLLPPLFSLLTLLTTFAGLPGGLCTRGCCPACASMFLTKGSWNSLCVIFFPPHEERRIWLFWTSRSNRWKNNFFVHFRTLQLIEYLLAILCLFSVWLMWCL
jgi:hypothetical protein